MKRNVKKLILSRETVRALQDSELAGVAGGKPMAVAKTRHCTAAEGTLLLRPTQPASQAACDDIVGP